MALTTEQQQQWQDNGYLLLKNFYSVERIDQINQLVDHLWKNRRTLDANYVIDVFVESDDERRMYFCDAPNAARNQPYKLNDLYLCSDEVRELIAGERIAPILGELLADFPMVCNSLNFEFGSQQEYHFDTFYMPSPTPNKMVASWIALENSTDLNGPLSYYPGSHKIPPYHFSNGTTLIVPEEMPEFHKYIDQHIRQMNLQPETLLASKGDVLIWHSQLFHGGNEILDKSKTRKSLVTHYFTREDFPEIAPPLITEQSCYMARNAQPVSYDYAAKTGWLRRFFGSLYSQN